MAMIIYIRCVARHGPCDPEPVEPRAASGGTLAGKTGVAPLEGSPLGDASSTQCEAGLFCEDECVVLFMHIRQAQGVPASGLVISILKSRNHERSPVLGSCPLARYVDVCQSRVSYCPCEAL